MEEDTTLAKELVKAVVLSAVLTVISYSFKKVLIKSVAKAELRRVGS